MANLFFINEKKKTENMMMVAPSSGQSSHRLAIASFFLHTREQNTYFEKKGWEIFKVEDS